VTHSSSQSWQKRRSEFNHDWLKNQYIPALAKCQNLLDGRVEDEEFESSFLTRIFPLWERHRGEALAIITLYEQMMSPARLLDEPPLSRLREGDKRWLGPVLHACWLSRTRADELAAVAVEVVRQVDASYLRLRQSLGDRWADDQLADLRPYAEQFAYFRERLQELANVVSAFPREINVA
jgi:hypothetical protein